MNWPPMLMHVKFQNEERDFGLWLPLFLLLPLALVVLIILSPLILIAVIVLWSSGWGPWALKVLKAAFGTLSAMRGLEVDIQDNNKHVYVSVV
jgi:hypothetical protein